MKPKRSAGITAKHIARLLVPPLLWLLASRWRRNAAPTKRLNAEFEGPLTTWADASRHAQGWENPALLEKLLLGALDVKNGRAASQQDIFTSDEVIYSQTILVFLSPVKLSRLGLLACDVRAGHDEGAGSICSRDFLPRPSGVLKRSVSCFVGQPKPGLARLVSNCARRAWRLLRPR